jgi:hypothetical protein
MLLVQDMNFCPLPPPPPVGPYSRRDGGAQYLTVRAALLGSLQLASVMFFTSSDGCAECEYSQHSNSHSLKFTRPCVPYSLSSLDTTVHVAGAVSAINCNDKC